jgi:hypothetical protein
MTPLVIVPARLGSKGVPNKNFRPLPDGSTLTQRAATIGVQFGDVVVTTDYPRLGDITLPFGVTRHRRPSELATDTASMWDVVREVLETYPGDETQPIILLQPTTPFRSREVIEKCVALLDGDVRLVGAATEVPEQYRPDRVLRIDVWAGVPLATPVSDSWAENRQSARRAAIYTGECYAFWRERAGGYRAVVLTEPQLNIDTESDWDLACARIRAEALTRQKDA